jgi:hemolysin III
MPSEEVANTISHGLGLLLAIAAVPILILAAMKAGSAHSLVGVSVFGGTMILLYLASTLYHSLTHEAAKQLFRLFDHAAIFLLIAGTYTPFALGVLRGPWDGRCWQQFGRSHSSGSHSRSENERDTRESRSCFT